MADEYVTRITDFEFYQGDTLTIPIEFTYSDGSPINLRECTVLVNFCPYGKYQDVSILTKKALVSETTQNLCTVELTVKDTENLDYGKYSYQPILVYADTHNGEPRIREYRRAEGDIVFRPRIKYDKDILNNQNILV